MKESKTVDRLAEKCVPITSTTDYVNAIDMKFVAAIKLSISRVHIGVNNWLTKSSLGFC